MYKLHIRLYKTLYFTYYCMNTKSRLLKGVTVLAHSALVIKRHNNNVVVSIN